VKNFVVVWLLVLVVLAVAGTVYAQGSNAEPRRLTGEPERAAGESQFVLAERSGEASQNERTFFVFSTSLAKYILRHDGFGEVTSSAGIRRMFSVKIGARERIERVYSLEYEGDLLLLYQAGETGYLARVSQKTRKMKAVLTVSADFDPPVLKDHRLVFSDGEIVSLK
jgi:hypothetical protein